MRRFFMNEDVTLKPATDQITVVMTATLPGNFAYILRSFNIELTADTATDWEPSCVLTLSSHITGQGGVGQSENMTCDMLVMRAPAGAVASMTISRAPDLSNFAGPFWAAEGASNAVFVANMRNLESAAGAAAFVIAHVEFLEYDLTQAQRYYINTPVPVLAR